MSSDDDQIAHKLDQIGQDATREAVALVNERFPDASPAWCLLVVLATAANMAGDDDVEWGDVAKLVQVAVAGGASTLKLQ